MSAKPGERTLSFKDWLARAFTWWNGATLGTMLWTRRRGSAVGRDADGNSYYQDKDGRRWVIYAGLNDSSRVPPEWYLWLHKTRDAPPTEAPLPVKAWEKPWRPNPTGTPAAELPPGSLARKGERERATSDYEAWSPE